MMTLRTWEYLSGPSAWLFWPAIVTGVVVAGMCAWLSVIVVLKRLAFIGQGVSHAAFGGVGVAAMLGLFASTTATTSVSMGQFAVIAGFCLASALLIGKLSEKSGERATTDHADTAIGVILVGSMALGAVLLHVAQTRRMAAGVSWESVLFGQLLAVTWTDAAIAAGVTAVVSVALVVWRRPLMLTLFDRPVAEALGVRVKVMNLVLLALLAVATVSAMKLAGVVLATAMLTLPGAAALRWSRRMSAVMMLALVIGVMCVLGGVVLSFELDWPPGPAIVLVMVTVYFGARGTGARR
ncbi:MAG: metal ABC transporter permease [Planctomycetes bacterium]|nr:metal ABC transporter permease [Planctomycetota bacterium]